MKWLVLAGLAVPLAVSAAAPVPAWSKTAFTKIVDSNTPQPGASFNFFFSPGDTPAIWGQTVVFRSAADKSVWTTTVGNASYQSVLDQSVPIPGMEPQTFSQDCGGACFQIIEDTVVFQGESVASGLLVGIYKVPAGGGRVRRLVDMNQIKTVSDSFPVGQFHVNSGPGDVPELVFDHHATAYDMPVGGGNWVEAAGSKDLGLTPPEPACCLAVQPDLSGGKLALLMGNDVGLGNVDTVRLHGDPRTFQVIAAQDFDLFSFSAPRIKQDTVVFAAESPDDSVGGVYSARGGAITALADSNTPVPGGTGNFQKGEFKQLAIDDGVVVFQGLDAANKLGLYEVPASGGAIRKIVAAGDPLGDGAVAGSVELGPEPISHHELVFLALWTNQYGIGLYATHL